MKKTILTLFSISLLMLLAHPAFASILFFDDFDGTGNLHGTIPDTTTGGATWVAGGSFLANGSQSGRGSATLAFTPVDGFVYRAETWLTDFTSGGEWVALGFAKGQSTGGAVGDVFTGDNVEGRAWMLQRAQGKTSNNTTFLTDNTGGADWSSFIDNRGDVGMRVDLDTTAGTGNWTATFYAKLNQADPWTMVRPAVTLTDEDITSVGISGYHGSDDFTTQSFTVTQIPEPSTISLILTALLGGMLVYRRRK